MLLSKTSYTDSFRFTLGHLQFCLILDFMVLRWLVPKSGEQTWLIFHAGRRCACVGKATLSGVWCLVRGGHLKMVASPTSERFCQSQTLNAVVVKLSVLFLCLFFVFFSHLLHGYHMLCWWLHQDISLVRNSASYP